MVFVPWGERPGSVFHAAQRIKQLVADNPTVGPQPTGEDPNIRLAMGGAAIGAQPRSEATESQANSGVVGDVMHDLIKGKDYYLDYVGATAATKEAVGSQLPGRVRGPADAYRHILWAAEMTRRFGPERAREMLGLHERAGDLDGQPDDEKNMDLRNNEIGLRIGVWARSFDDVISASRKVISGSAPDGSGAWKPGYDRTSTLAPYAAGWLPEERWDENPKFDPRRPVSGNAPMDEPMPTAMTNWYSNPDRSKGPDWVAGYLPEPYKYPYGSARHATGADDSEMLRGSEGYRAYLDFFTKHPGLRQLMRLF